MLHKNKFFQLKFIKKSIYKTQEKRIKTYINKHKKKVKKYTIKNLSFFNF